MTKKQIYQLLKNGYKEMITTGEDNPFQVFYTSVGMTLLYVMFGNAIKFKNEEYKELKSSFDKQIARLGGDTKSFLILSVDSRRKDYLEELAVAKQVCAENKFCWIYDEAIESTILFENQIEEFYGLRRILDKSAEVSDEEAELVIEKTYDSSGRVQTEKEKFKFSELPFAAISFIIINIIVYILCLFTGDLLYNIGVGNQEMLDSPDQYYRMITAMFLHANIGHIVMNMFLLFFLGLNIEKPLKSSWFVVVYMMSGIVGNLCECLKINYLQEESLFLGASGAVYGMVGAYLAMLLFKEIKNPHARLPWIVIGLAIMICSGLLESTIADMAHFAGLVAGFLSTAVICFVKARLRKREGKTNEN